MVTIPWRNTGSTGDIPESLQALLRTSRVKRFPKGQIMLYEGDTTSEVYVVKLGAVKLFDIDTNGNEKILHIVGPPTLLPFAFYSSLEQPLRWFYGAVNDCEVYVLPAAELRAAMQADAVLAEAMVTKLAFDMHEVLARLSSLGKTSVQEKLLAALLFLMTHHSSATRLGWHRVAFPVTHQLLADLAGVTRESVALCMKEFQTQKIIRNPKLNLLDINSERLNALHA